MYTDEGLHLALNGLMIEDDFESHDCHRAKEEPSEAVPASSPTSRAVLPNTNTTQAL